VLLIDLNGFKQVNDTRGHQAGDGLLVAVADAMRRSVRPGDLVARLGGDEFAVVMQPIVTATEAAGVAQRIVDAIAGPFVVGDLPMSGSASVGVALSSAGAGSADALLHRADLAMYDQKRRGGGWQLWHPGLEATDGLEADLAEAFDAGQFTLCYRPLVTLTDGSTVGRDAIPTWDHPSRGPITPDVFRPLAERAGLGERLDSWMLHEAAAESARTGRTIGLEVTHQQLRRPGFVDTLRAALTLRELFPYAVLLHLPPGLLAGELSELRALGVRLATHDLTDAYAAADSLDFLVLDDPRGAEVTDAVIGLGHSLGLTVVSRVPVASLP
jgi:diguanylate cyclase (GGDEF)-like protein